MTSAKPKAVKRIAKATRAGAIFRPERRGADSRRWSLAIPPTIAILGNRGGCWCWPRLIVRSFPIRRECDVSMSNPESPPTVARQQADLAWCDPTDCTLTLRFVLLRFATSRCVPANRQPTWQALDSQPTVNLPGDGARNPNRWATRPAPCTRPKGKPQDRIFPNIRPDCYSFSKLAYYYTEKTSPKPPKRHR